jgi:hypothetical protein
MPVRVGALITRTARACASYLAALPSTRAIEIDSCAPAHLKLVRVPGLSPLPSRLCLLCRFSQKLHSTCRFAHLCRTPPAAPFVRFPAHSPLPTAALP